MSKNIKNPLDHNIFPMINYDKYRDVKIKDMSDSFENIIDGICSKFKDVSNKSKYIEKRINNTNNLIFNGISFVASKTEEHLDSLKMQYETIIELFNNKKILK